jgi:signal transduction histidine kinase
MTEVPRAHAGSGALPGITETTRLAVLSGTGLLDAEADASLDAFAGLAAALLGTPSAYVTLVAAEGQVSPGAVEQDHTGPPMRRLPMHESICQFQVATGEPLFISDTRTDPLSQNKLAVQDGSMLAYAGSPLLAGGQVLGSLCVVDQQPRAWSASEVELLRSLAQLVTNDIEHRLSARRVASMGQLGQRFADELPPLLTALSGLVELAEHADDPRLQRAAASAHSRAHPVRDALARVVEAVGQLEPPPRSAALHVDLRRAVERAASAARATTGTSELVVRLPPEPLLMRTDPVRLERALVHLLVSSLHHKRAGEVLSVSLERREDASVALTVSAAGDRIPAAELGRIVTRFREASEQAAEAPPGSAALRLVRGAVHASSGGVSGRSSADSTSFHVRWTAEPAPGAESLTP